MSLLQNIAGGLRGLFRKEEAEQEMDEELRGYLDACVREKVAAGMNPTAALRAARQEIGSLEGVKENVRAAGWEYFIESLWQDVRFGARVLRKSPGFTIVAIVTLALGIGANSAIFSVVNAILLRPLPFNQPDRLLNIYHTPPQTSFPGMKTFPVSPANFLDWRSQNRSFEGMSAYAWDRVTLSGRGRPEAIQIGLVNSAFFSILRARPLMGRVFEEEEDNPGRGHEIVMSYGFWRSYFGGDPEVVGKDVELDGEPFLVVGVMTPDFDFPIVANPSWRVQVWKPLAWTDRERAARDNHSFLVLARLKDDVSLSQAQADLDAISSHMAQQYPKDDKGWGAIAVPLSEDLVGDVRPSLLILLGAAGFVLLIASANIANLMLARTLSRRKEIAVRAALGAGRSRLLQQALTETVLLALAGGLLGLVFAHYSVELIVIFLVQRLPRHGEIGVDDRVLIFTLGVSLLTGFTAGLLPALRLAKENPNQALKESPRQVASDAVGSRTRSMLVVSEVALSLMLLMSAGLLIRSFWILRTVYPGFDPNHVLTMRISIPNHKFADPSQENQFFARVLDHVRALPGVESAGTIDSLPLDGGSHQPIFAEEWPVLPMSDLPEVDVRVISPGYLRAMHIPLLDGRDFDDSDAEGRAGAVLISQTMATQFWPNESAIGKHVKLYFFPELTRVVVGIVADVKQDGLNQMRPAASLYFPLAQESAPADREWQSFGMDLAVRSTQNPSSITTAVANSVHQVDSEVALLNVRTMDESVSASLSPQRFSMLLLALFAGLALLLAAIGIYSVISYSVSRRTHEIGIRISLGASCANVLLLVLRQGMALAAVGLGIGIMGALGLSRLMATIVHDITASDPLTFAAVSLLLIMVALVACYIPARRATRVDPMIALRHE